MEREPLLCRGGEGQEVKQAGWFLPGLAARRLIPPRDAVLCLDTRRSLTLPPSRNAGSPGESPLSRLHNPAEPALVFKDRTIYFHLRIIEVSQC